MEDEYGVAASEITWVTGGVEEVGRYEKTPIKVSDEVTIISGGDVPLSRQLSEGTIDAILAPRAPSCFDGRDKNIGPLFPDVRKTEAAYFRKTGHFPIMHLVGVRKDIVAKNPWVPSSVMKAFSKARKVCLPRLYDPTALAVMLSWLNAEAQFTLDVMGPDPWSYGVERNKDTIDTLFAYHHAQGLSDRLLTLDDVFHAGTMENFRI